MIKTSTENELVRFLYNETNAKEDQEFLKLMLLDDHLQEELDDLIILKKHLDKVLIKAPERAIDKILSFVKQIDMESA